jgi:hypothetical protein
MKQFSPGSRRNSQTLIDSPEKAIIDIDAYNLVKSLEHKKKTLRKMPQGEWGLKLFERNTMGGINKVLINDNPDHQVLKEGMSDFLFDTYNQAHSRESTFIKMQKTFYQH